MSWELAFIPLGILLVFLGAKLQLAGTGSYLSGRTSLGRLLIALLAETLSITAAPFLLSVAFIDDSDVMLQSTFGAAIANIGLSIAILFLAAKKGISGIRLELCVIGFGTIFLTVMGFTGYLAFVEAMIFIIAVVLVLLVPYMMGKWKEDVKDVVPELEAAGKRLPRARAALLWAAGTVLVVAGIWSAILGVVVPAYDDMLFSQVVMAFVTGAVVAIAQAVVPATLSARGQNASALTLLVICLYFNCIFVLLAMFCLPLVQV